MPDLLRGTIDLMNAPDECLKQRTYNITAMSFTPSELAASIRKIMPSFTIEYKPDFRQQIAETWPRALDDTSARRDWGWAPRFDVDVRMLLTPTTYRTLLWIRPVAAMRRAWS